jgi:hypothetical protein
MQGYHWLFLAAVLIAGLFIQKYMDPLSKVGL